MVLDREQRLLDAAIDVLGTRGMRQLTHRAVDAAAGLPVGSTSNRFRTRESLLVGVLRRILERETAMWTRLAIDIRTPTVEAVASAIGRLLESSPTTHTCSAKPDEPSSSKRPTTPPYVPRSPTSNTRSASGWCHCSPSSDRPIRRVTSTTCWR